MPASVVRCDEGNLMKALAITKQSLHYLLLTAVAVAWLLPAIILVNGALANSNLQIPSLLPHAFAFGNFREVWDSVPIARMVFNSAFVTVLSAVGILVLGGLGGFGLAHFRLPGANLALLVLLAGIVISPSSLIVPLYRLISDFHLLNTYPALIGPYTALNLPVSVLLFRNAFLALPPSLAESAMIDGASNSRILARIYVPLAMPTVATVGIISILACWNDYLFALLFMTSNSMQTIQLSLLAFQGQYLDQYPDQFAIMAMVAIPMVVIFIVGQRRFVKGLTAGAVQ
jgi:raffinose/stachyose/melibiose transport system permease protein